MKNKRSKPQRLVIKTPDDSNLITLRFTTEEFELFFDMIEHVYDLNWTEFVKEANARRRELAESFGDKLEAERTLTVESFERIFGKICDMQYNGSYGSGPQEN
jgi:hypothetical protein